MSTDALREPIVAAGKAKAHIMIPQQRSAYWTSSILLIGLGVSAGFFAVPLQVFLQARPPKEQKGRMIGAMNLVNWIGILLAAGFYGLCSDWFTEVATIKGQPPVSHISWTFALVAGMLIPVALFYRPADQPLRHDDETPAISE